MRIPDAPVAKAPVADTAGTQRRVTPRLEVPEAKAATEAKPARFRFLARRQAAPTVVPALEPKETDLRPTRAAWKQIAPPTRGERIFGAVLMGLMVAVFLMTIAPVALLRVMPAYTSSFMLHYQVSRWFSEREMPPLRHEWVSWDQISPQVKLAVIAAEDQRFADHHGIDMVAIEKAMEHNQRSRRKRGASTISQQVAKNLFLTGARTWTRKGAELGYTLLIEWMWPKQRILEVYLNVAEFGEGVYGVEAAAQKYFRKPAAKLTSYEAALMAAVLPNPKRLKLAAPSGYVLNRASAIQGQMYRIGTGYLKDL